MPSKVSYVSLFAIFTLSFHIQKILVPSKENQNISLFLQIKIMPARIVIFDQQIHEFYKNAGT